MNVRVHGGQRSASGVSPLPALLGGMKRHTQDLASRSDSQNHIVKAAVLDNRGFWGGQTPALTLGLRGHLGAEGAAPPLRVTGLGHRMHSSDEMAHPNMSYTRAQTGPAASRPEQTLLSHSSVMDRFVYFFFFFPPLLAMLGIEHRPSQTIQTIYLYHTNHCFF